MLLNCSHGIPWNKTCSMCEVQESAWDITSIDIFMQIHRDLRNPNIETLAMNSWERQRKRWYQYHDGLHDIGGEA